MTKHGSLIGSESHVIMKSKNEEKGGQDFKMAKK